MTGMASARLRFHVLWLAALLAIISCGKRKAPAPESPPKTTDVAALESDRLAAAVITIAHAQVEHYAGVRPKPGRTKEESLAMAKEICATARKEPARFRELAMDRSEDPFGAEGGELRAWTKGEDKALDDAVAPLAIGAISDPVDTEYGYRIFLRQRPLPLEKLSARHIVVAWAGATRAPAAMARSKAEAATRSQELAVRARRDPGAFEALTRAESDGWDKQRGGSLGQWMADGGRYPVAFDRAVAALAEGAVSEPIETEFGYQIFQRVAPKPEALLLSGAHILVAFRGAEKARAGVGRTRREAETEAARIAAKARANPAAFGQLAVAYSDDPSGSSGGDLGVWTKGEMPAPIDEALASLKIGEVSGPVSTPFGYHVLLRREAPTDKAYVVK